MTREERKQYVSDNFTFLAISDAFSLIDQVYNDIADLEAPKTCNGCKFFDDEFKECGKTLDVNVPAYIDFMGCGLYDEKVTQ